MLREEFLFSLALSLSLSFAHGKCKLNSFCMFEELSQITRSSLRLSLFNCPSISGVVVDVEALAVAITEPNPVEKC